MKKLLLSLTSLMLISGSAVNVVSCDNNTGSNILNDKVNLSQVIKDPIFLLLLQREFASHIKNGFISKKFLETVTSLSFDLSKMGGVTISNLQGIGIFTNLKKLVLANTSISDLTPLTSLTNLNTLSLKVNTIIGDTALNLTPLTSLTSLTNLDLSFDNNFQNVQPLSKLTNLTKLKLVADNLITDFSPLESLKKLTLLDLSNVVNKGSSASINLDFLKSLTNLQNLSLIGDQLGTISSNKAAQITDLASVHSLTSLNLNNNGITGGANPSAIISILSNDSQYFPKLTSLNLGANSCWSFISSLTSLGNLTELDLSDNAATTGNFDLTNFTSLQNLDLSNDGLTQLPILFNKNTGLGSLSTLDLSFNDFSKVSTTNWNDNISNLNNLVILNLSNDGLTQLPNLSYLTNLQNLNLSSNAFNFTLTPKPDWTNNIGKLNNLVTLNLSNDNITSLPFSSTMAALSNLTTLNLTFNELTSGSGLSNWFPNLTTLDLSHNNKFSSVVDLKGFANLQTLNLDYDNISKLDDFLQFKSLKTLRTLNLSGNAITELPDISALGISGLKNLDLSNNKIQKFVDPEAIGKLTNLTVLNMSNDQLTDISFLDSLSNLTILDLSNNNIKHLSGVTKSGNSWSITDFGSKLFDQEMNNGSNWVSGLNLSGNEIASNSPDWNLVHNLPGNPLGSGAWDSKAVKDSQRTS